MLSRSYVALCWNTLGNTSISKLTANLILLHGIRHKSTASSSRWLARQTKDPATKEAKANQLRARSAYKLMEINEKYKLFKKGQTVVDLGFAPGAWSQVALSHVGSRGRVLGIDILPATPPKGVAAMQANFMSRRTHVAILQYLSEPDRGRRIPLKAPPDAEDKENEVTEKSLLEPESYIDLEKRVTADDAVFNEADIILEIEKTKPKLVNIVLSDMMSNTTGLKVADHGASIDLCECALLFCIESLKTGGHFVCKVFNGSEANDLKDKMKAAFRTVHVMKPDSSRKESVEIYFIGMHKKASVKRTDVFPSSIVQRPTPILTKSPQASAPITDKVEQKEEVTAKTVM